MAFCTHCGTQLPESAQFCSTCGKAFAPEAPTAPAELDSAPETPVLDEVAAAALPIEADSATIAQAPVLDPAPPTQTRGLKPLTILALVIGILAVAGAAFGAYLVFGGTPKQRLMLAEYNYVQKRMKEVEAEGQVSLALQKSMAQDPSTSQFTISGSVKTSDGSIPANVQRLIEKSQIVLNSSTDPKAGRSLAQVRVNMQGSELISGELQSSKDLLGIRVPVLYDKYIYLENKGVKETFTRLGIPYSGGDRFLTQSDFEPLLKTNAAELQAVGVSYGKELINLIREEEVVLEKGVTVSSPDSTVTLDRITLSLSEARVQEILRSLSTKFRGDERALDLISEKVAQFAQLGLDSGSLPPTEQDQMRTLLNREQVKSEIRKGAQAFDTELTKLHLPEGLKLVALLDGREIVQQTLSFSFGPDSTHTAQMALGMENWPTKDGGVQRSLGLKLLVPSQGVDVNVEGKSRTTKVSNKESNTTASYVLEAFDRGNEQANLRLDVTSNLVKDAEKGKDKATHNFDLSLGKAGPVAIKGKLTSLYSNSFGKRFEAKNDLDLSFDSKDSYTPTVGLALKTELTVETKADVKFPDVNGTTAFNLSKATRADMDRLAGEITKAVDRFVRAQSRLFS